MKNYFAELNEHENRMLNVWLEFLAEGYDGDFNGLDEEPSFEEWLEFQIQFYGTDDDGQPCESRFADEYRQALAEWRAEC